MPAKKPKKPPIFPGATHAARVFGPACGDSLELFLRVEKGVILEARFEAQACRATVALARLATEKASGVRESEIFSWSAEQLISWIPQASKTKTHAAALVIEAFREALQAGERTK